MQWTWTWASFGRWRGTGWPGVLQPVGSQRIRHDWATEQQQLLVQHWVHLFISLYSIFPLSPTQMYKLEHQLHESVCLFCLQLNLQHLLQCPTHSRHPINTHLNTSIQIWMIKCGRDVLVPWIDYISNTDQLDATPLLIIWKIKIKKYWRRQLEPTASHWRKTKKLFNPIFVLMTQVVQWT